MKKLVRGVLVGATSLMVAAGGMTMAAPADATWGWKQTFSYRDACLRAKADMQRHQENLGFTTYTVKNCVPNGEGGYDVFLIRQP